MDYISGWCHSKRRLDGQTAIVTGANTGIGKETAQDLYQRGARVIMACRDLKKAEAAIQDIHKSTTEDNSTSSLVIEKLDLSSLRSVRDFCARVLKNESQINILVNNAGVLCPQSKTEDGFETHIGINHFGHALLTLLLLPRLIQSAPARIVTVSSLANILYNLDLDDINVEKSYGGFKAYSRSKSANILFSKALDLNLKEHNIKGVNTYSLHPGIISTDLGRHLNNTFFNGASWIVNNIVNPVLQSPRCGAQTSIYCAVDEACANESGYYYSGCGKSKLVARQCQNPDIALQLWDLTVDKLNLRDYNPFSGKDPDTAILQRV